MNAPRLGLWGWAALALTAGAGAAAARGPAPDSVRVDASTLASMLPGAAGWLSEIVEPEAGPGRVQGVQGVQGEPQVRVRVGKSLSEARIEASGAPESRLAPGARLRVIVGPRDEGLLLDPPVFVKGGEGAWRIIDGRGTCYQRGRLDVPARVQSAAVARRVVRMPLVPLVVEVRPAGEPPRLVLGDRELAGDLLIVARGEGESGGARAGRVDVIEEVGLEDYLPGVVAGEMYAHWPPAAHAAQAVAARSYALNQVVRARAVGRAWDLEGSTLDQAYVGASASPAARRGVIGTRGIVLAFEGQVLRAYYSASSGGRTAAAGTLWGGAMNAAAPLQAEQVDEYAVGTPVYRWTVTRTRDDLAARLRGWGEREGHAVRLLDELRTIEVASRSRVNKPLRYAVVDAGGAQFILSAEQMRVACNYAGAGSAVGRTLGVLSEDQRVRSGDLEFEFGAEQVRIDGRGLGHGVGLSQWSAKVMGERGIGWRAILAKFYPGAQVVRAY